MPLDDMDRAEVRSMRWGELAGTGVVPHDPGDAKNRTVFAFLTRALMGKVRRWRDDHRAIGRAVGPARRRRRGGPFGGVGDEVRKRREKRVSDDMELTIGQEFAARWMEKHWQGVQRKAQSLGRSAENLSRDIAEAVDAFVKQKPEALKPLIREVALEAAGRR